MVPFRVFNKESKEMWVVLNYHPSGGESGDGAYLLAREDDSENDGELCLLDAGNMTKFRLVDFLDEGDSLKD